MNFFIKPFFDLGILFLRIFAGGLLFFAHGLPKIVSFSETVNKFGDPLGFGSEITFLMAVFAEAICTILVIVGFFTRLAVLPILATMLTAGFIVHADDPFNVAEKSLLFAVAFSTILITGPGSLSLDRVFISKKKLYY